MPKKVKRKQTKTVDFTLRVSIEAGEAVAKARKKRITSRKRPNLRELRRGLPGAGGGGGRSPFSNPGFFGNVQGLTNNALNTMANERYRLEADRRQLAAEAGAQAAAGRDVNAALRQELQDVGGRVEAMIADQRDLRQGFREDQARVQGRVEGIYEDMGREREEAEAGLREAFGGVDARLQDQDGFQQAYYQAEAAAQARADGQDERLRGGEAQVRGFVEAAEAAAADARHLNAGVIGRLDVLERGHKLKTAARLRSQEEMQEQVQRQGGGGQPFLQRRDADEPQRERAGAAPAQATPAGFEAEDEFGLQAHRQQVQAVRRGAAAGGGGGGGAAMAQLLGERDELDDDYGEGTR